MHVSGGGDYCCADLVAGQHEGGDYCCAAPTPTPQPRAGRLRERHGMSVGRVEQIVVSERGPLAVRWDLFDSNANSNCKEDGDGDAARAVASVALLVGSECDSSCSAQQTACSTLTGSSCPTASLNSNYSNLHLLLDSCYLWASHAGGGGLAVARGRGPRTLRLGRLRDYGLADVEATTSELEDMHREVEGDSEESRCESG